MIHSLAAFTSQPRQEGFYWVRRRDWPINHGWTVMLYTTTHAFDPDGRNMVRCDPVFIEGQRSYTIAPGCSIMEVGNYLGYGPVGPIGLQGLPGPGRRTPCCWSCRYDLVGV